MLKPIKYLQYPRHQKKLNGIVLGKYLFLKRFFIFLNPFRTNTVYFFPIWRRFIELLIVSFCCLFKSSPVEMCCGSPPHYLAPSLALKISSVLRSYVLLMVHSTPSPGSFHRLPRPSPPLNTKVTVLWKSFWSFYATFRHLYFLLKCRQYLFRSTNYREVNKRKHAHLENGN